MRAEIDRVTYELDILHEREGDYVAMFGGISHQFEIHEVSRDTVRFRHDGVMESVTLLRDSDRLHFLHRGLTHTVRDLTLAAPEPAAAGGDGKVRAAMNGRVVAVLVKKGDHVEADQPVMTLEAMKMEHVHAAGIAGTIVAIDVVEGEQVTTGKVVVEIEAASK
jgi:geranyl-CoA carboxylase alpha subunit